MVIADWIELFRARLWFFSRLKRSSKARRRRSLTHLAIPVEVLESRILLAAAVNDSFSLQSPAAATQLAVLANDSGTHPTIVSVTQASHGTTEVRPYVSNSIWQEWQNYGHYSYNTFSDWYDDYYGDPSTLTWGVRYTPATGYTGSDSFTYTIADGAGQSTATAAITIAPPANQHATVGLQNAVANLSETTSTASRVKLADVVVTDDGLGTNVLGLTGADAALLEIYDGDVYLKAGTTLSYANNPQLTATVTVDDATISGSPDASVAISVNVFKPADAHDDSVTTPQNQAAYYTNLLANDEGSGLKLVSATQPAHGTTELRPDVPTWMWQEWLSWGHNQFATFGAWYQDYYYADPSTLTWGVRYTPTTGYSGSDSFTYTISDGTSQDTATVAVTVSPPTNQHATLSLQNAIANLSETTSTASRVKLADIVVTDDGLGTNVLGLTGADAALLEIYDGEVYLKAGTTLSHANNPQLTATVTVDDATISGSPDASIALSVNVVTQANANNDSVTTQQNVAAFFTTLLANDEGSGLKLVFATQAAHGTTELRPNVSASIWQEWQYHGTHDFDTFSEWYGEYYGDPSTLTWGVRYTPTTGYSGSDSFTYTISDGASQDTATVAVTVTPPANQHATLGLQNVVANLSETTSTASRVKLADIVVTDDGQGTNVLGLTGADAALLEIYDGDVYLKAGTTLSHANNPQLTATITVDDATISGSPDASVALTVNVVTPADAHDDSVTTIKNQSAFYNHLLDNDGGSNARLLSATQPAHGSTELQPDVSASIWQEWQSHGHHEFDTFSEFYDYYYGDPSTLTWGVRYTPTTGYTGSDSFTYTIADGASQDTATVTVTVTLPPNQPATVGLQNALATLPETTSTAGRVKLADIFVTDDGQGTNVLGLTGADAALLEIFDGDIYLKAGATLDHASNPQLTATVTVDDASFGGSPDATVALTVNVANNNQLPANLSTREDTPLSLTGSNAIAIGAVTSGQVSVSLSLGEGMLEILGTTTTLQSCIGNGTGAIQISGTLANVNAALGSLRFTPTADFNGVATITITTVELNAAGGSPRTDIDMLVIAVIAANDAPGVDGPSAITIAEEETGHLTGADAIVVNNPDNISGTAQLSVRLSANHGRISILGGTAGLDAIYGDSSRFVQLLGRVDAVNQALASVDFTPDEDFAGQTSLSIEAADTLNSGADGPLQSSHVVAITVTARNDAPENHLLESRRTTANTPLLLEGYSAVSVRDVDAANAAVRVTVTATHGALTAGGSLASLTSCAGNGTGTVVLTGTVTAINTALTSLRFVPATDYTGDAILTVTTDDLGNTGAGGALTDVDAMHIRVDPNWQDVSNPPPAPPNGTSPTQAGSSYQTSLTSAVASFQAALNSATTSHDGATNSAASVHDAAIAAALTTFQSVVGGTDSTNAAAVAAANSVLQTALGAFASSVSGISFDGFTWPDAPAELQVQLEGVQPAVEPHWTGASFNPESDPAFQAALAVLTASRSAASAQAEQIYQQSMSAAAATYQFAVQAAANQKQQSLNQANQAYQQAVAQPNPFDDDVDSALEDYQDNWQAVLDQRYSALQAAYQAYSNACNAAAQAAAGPHSTYVESYQASYQYGVAVADASATLALAIEAAQNSSDHALRQLELGIADLLAEQANWSAYNSASASLQLAVAMANVTETYQDQVAQAQEIRSQVEAQATENRAVTMAGVVASFHASRATQLAAAVSAWAAGVGTAWAAYQQAQAVHKAAYDQAVALAYQSLSVALAQATEANDEALAAGTEDKAEAYAAAARNRDVTNASLNYSDAVNRIAARESRRGADADAAFSRDNAIADAHQDFVETIVEARRNYARASAASWRDYAIRTWGLWDSYNHGGISQEEYYDAVTSANTDYRHANAGIWHTFAITSINAQAGYQDTSEGINRAYVQQLGESYGDFQTAINDASLIHLTAAALADADYADAVSAADHTYAVAVADADFEWANSAANIDCTLAINLANAQRDLSISSVTDHRTFAQAVMTAFVNETAAWSASVAGATPEWGQYYVNLALAEQARTTLTENAQVAFTTGQAESSRLTALADALATKSWDVSAANRDHDYAVATADADRNRDFTKTYVMFDAVAAVGGHSYSGTLTVDFARDFVNAFASSQATAGGANDNSQQQVRRNALYASFQDVIQAAGRERQRAVLDAWYDFEMDSITFTDYIQRINDATAAYRQAYLDALATYRHGLADVDLAPGPAGLAPIDVPPELGDAEEVRLSAADRLIDADRTHRLAIAAAERADALNAAVAQADFDLAVSAHERTAAIDRAAAQESLDVSVAQAQAGYEQNAAAAQATFQVSAWTRIRNARQTIAQSVNTPVSVYYAAYAQSRLDSVTAQTARNTTLVTQITAADVQAAATVAALARVRDVNLANAQGSYDASVIAASHVLSVALANAEYTREAGGGSAGGDANDEANYRRQVAFDSVEYDYLARAALGRYNAQVRAARYAELSQAIDTSHDYQSGDVSAGDASSATNAAAAARRDGVHQARIDYVEDAARFYFRYISALAEDDAEYAANLAGNEFDYAIDAQAADDTYAAAERSAGASQRMAEAYAARDYTVGEAGAHVTSVAAAQGATVDFNQALVAVRATVAGARGQAEANYHIATAQSDLQQSLSANAGPFAVAALSARVAWLQAVAPQYVALTTAVAQADGQFELADAQFNRTYENTREQAGAVATTVSANSALTRTLSEGVANDAFAAATDAAWSAFNVQIAALNRTALIDSAVVRANHSLQVAQARSVYDVELVLLPRDSTADQSAFNDCVEDLNEELRNMMLDANVEEAAALGDVAVQWVALAANFGVAYIGAYAAALGTRAGIVAQAVSTQATALADAEYNLSIALAQATANQWVGESLAAETRDYAQAVARTNFFLAQEQSNAVAATTFVGQFRQGAVVLSLTLLNDNGASTTDRVTSDPTLTGSVDLKGLVDFAQVEFDFDGNGTIDGVSYTDLAGHFTYTPPGPALPNGSRTVRARTNVDGTVSGWTSLALTLTDDGVDPAIAGFNVHDLNQGVSASSLLEGSIAASGSLSGVTIQFDVNGDGTSDAQTTTDSQGHFSYTVSGLSEGYTLVSARVAGGQWNRLGFVHTSHPDAARAIQVWGEFVIARATAKYAWAQTTATAWNAMAAAEAAARVQYAGLVAADSLSMATATAAANRSDSLVIAAWEASEIVDSADADADYLTGLAPAERDYRIAVAQIERQHQIDLADASRFGATNWESTYENTSAANQRQTQNLQNAYRKFATVEGDLALGRATRLATDDNASASAIAAAAMTRATVTATAAQTFANAQTLHAYDLAINLAGRERDFALLSGQEFLDEMNDLSSGSPSPWSVHEAALAQAEKTRSQAVAGAQYAQSVSLAGADRTLAELSTLAEVDYALTLASAEAAQFVGTTVAHSSYLVALAAARRGLTYSGAYDAPLILPIGDVPPLMSDGEAAAHLDDDAGLATGWYLPYYGDGSAWGYGITSYYAYDGWLGYYDGFGYYDAGEYIYGGDLSYLGYYGGYGYDGYYGGYYGGWYFGGYYGGYYGGGYGLGSYDPEIGYYGLYSGYGWWSGYASPGWTSPTVGSLTFPDLTDLTHPATGLNTTGGSAYAATAGNSVDSYLPSVALQQGSVSLGYAEDATRQMAAQAAAAAQQQVLFSVPSEIPKAQNADQQSANAAWAHANETQQILGRPRQNGGSTPVVGGSSTTGGTIPGEALNTPAQMQFLSSGTRYMEGLTAEQEKQILSLFLAMYGDDGQKLLAAFHTISGNTIVVEDIWDWWGLIGISDYDYVSSTNSYRIQLDVTLLSDTANRNPAVAAQELWKQLQRVMGQDYRIGNALFAPLVNSSTFTDADIQLARTAYEARVKTAAGTASLLAQMYIQGVVEWTPAGWVNTTAYYAADGRLGEAALSALPAIGVVRRVKGGKLADDALPAPRIRVTGEALAKLRKDFNGLKPKAWMEEAVRNSAKYTEAQLLRMRDGLTPIGSDGFPMEIHHKLSLAEGGANTFDNYQFMTKTEHRLGLNYKKNHPNLP